MIRIKTAIVTCALLFSFIAYAGGPDSGQERSKYFVGIGAGEGGGAYGGSFKTLRMSRQSLLSHNTTYDFDYLSEIALNIWKDDSRLSASNKSAASSDLDLSLIHI